jgi:MFS family permease
VTASRAKQASARPTESGAARQRLEAASEPGGMAVLRNRPFLLLWLAQVTTQVGGNTVTYGLTILINTRYNSAAAVSALLLSFLVPAIVFSAIAGVFVDMVDKRQMLIVTNVLRCLAFLAIVFAGDNLLVLYLLMICVATLTTFFGPAEASMIPFLVPRPQLLAANGLFTLTMNMAFAAGFALVGPFVIALASPAVLILLVAAMYLVAAGFCWTLPPSPPAGDNGVTAGQAVADAQQAVRTMVAELSEGMAYIRDHREISWSLSYLGITGALVGILAVLGPGFAKTALQLGEKDFVVVVLPIGLGIVVGIVGLNAFGRLIPRRRAIEAGMISLGVLLAILSFAGPVSQFLENNVATQIKEASRVASVLSIVIGIAFAVGLAFAVVSISSQTQLQEDLAEDVRGRVFGVLNMLVSIASLAPIIVVGPLADLIGRDPLILFVGLLVATWGIASVMTRGSLAPAEIEARAGAPRGVAVDDVQIQVAPAELAGGNMPTVVTRDDVAGRDDAPAREHVD